MALSAEDGTRWTMYFHQESTGMEARLGTSMVISVRGNCWIVARFLQAFVVVPPHGLPRPGNEVHIERFLPTIGRWTSVYGSSPTESRRSTRSMFLEHSWKLSSTASVHATGQYLAESSSPAPARQVALAPKAESLAEPASNFLSPEALSFIGEQQEGACLDHTS